MQHYIVFDLEFNQDFTSLEYLENKRMSKYIFEIIQIGAVKLDEDFTILATFNRYVRPTIYSKLNPFIKDLTGITTEQLLLAEPFPEVYRSFIEFIGGNDFIFCTWGMSDIKELYRNVEYHRLNQKFLPKLYINLQPYVSKQLGLPSKQLLQLQNAVAALNITYTCEFHNALHDAYYTSEILKIVNNQPLEPKSYDPTFVAKRPVQRKRAIDFDRLLQQFNKMYNREITVQEQEIIKLAYKMGRTNQFLK